MLTFSYLQSVAPPAPPPDKKGDKKSAPNTAGVMASPSKISAPTTPSHMFSIVSAISPNINTLLNTPNQPSVSIVLVLAFHVAPDRQKSKMIIFNTVKI